MSHNKDLRLSRDADGIAWLWLDRAGASTNTLSSPVLAALDDALDALQADPPIGLVIASAKDTGFIAGADVEEFTRLDTPAAARELLSRGWDLCNRLAAVSFPTLALIRGHCMGGGLELSLACTYRIAVDEPGTRLALPEVMLGIVPGWGGMQRLPETVGPLAALDMMLSGKGIDAYRAARMGLADACVPVRVMEDAARALLRSGQPRRRPPLWQRLLNDPAKPLVAALTRRQVAAKVNPAHYPAPGTIIDIWQRHGGNALAAPEIIDRLLASPTAKNLIRVFFLQERLKAFGKAEAAAGFAPRHVHVVGAGVMGGDIAAWCAASGLTVTLQDQSYERIAPAIGRAAAMFARKFRGRRADAERRSRAALDRLIPDPQGLGVARADVIIEAIFEDLAAKQALFAALERRARPDALLATNTSSLKLEDIATALAAPRRLVGLHFFNPVARVPLVEVVHGAQSDAGEVDRALAFARRLDKLPLPVASAPGFLVNAVLAPYMLEALRCVEEGIAAETVDRALVDFGMPMGPVELVDVVGLDIALAAGRALAGDAPPPARLAELVAAGHLGRKSGRGYYQWKGGKAVRRRRRPAGDMPSGLARRIIEPLLAAAQHCVAEGVVADADLADAGVIFGTGFAPWTGGPLSYLQLLRQQTETAPAGASPEHRNGEAP
jgi:3-hydroxyacyl-CoA dehydrogenase/enoyl-CoA hydratase/3-hydroxybutyryl-CoA epimerase